MVKQISSHQMAHMVKSIATIASFDDDAKQCNNIVVMEQKQESRSYTRIKTWSDTMLYFSKLFSNLIIHSDICMKYCLQGSTLTLINSHLHQYRLENI